MTYYDLDDATAYQQWRAKKLNWASDSSLYQPVTLAGETVSDDEKQAIAERLEKVGFCIYSVAAGFMPDKQWLIDFGLEFGLERLDSNLCADSDSISTLKVKTEGRGKRYIPYTDRPINWHTDGYYNPPEHKINGLILHCESPAAEGGDSAIFDNELAYIALRDKDPNYIIALSHPSAMCIPPNQENGEEIRDWECGPVFTLNPDAGRLHMRYTARQRSIRWRDDPTTLEAVEFLQNLLTSGENGVIEHRLKAGEGIICHNSLHNRKGFKDSDSMQRLYYRARYFDPIKL